VCNGDTVYIKQRLLLVWLDGRGHPLVSIACLTILCHSARSVAFHLSACAGPPCTNPWYHPSILDKVSLSVLCPPSHQTLWFLTFVRPSSGKCGQRIGVFSVLWSEIRFCWLQWPSSPLHSWLSVATGCAKSTCNTSFQRQVVSLCQAFSMSMSH